MTAPRPPRGPPPSQRFMDALDNLRRRGTPRLGGSEPPLEGSIYLRLDLAAPAEEAGAELAGAAGSEERGIWLARLVAAALDQHASLLAGIASTPPKNRWPTLGSIVMVPPATANTTMLVDVLTAQSIAVELDGTAWRLPVQAVAGELPPGHVRVVVKGLHPAHAREGLMEALLSAAGYAPDEVTVVSERGGHAGVPGAAGVPAGLLVDLSVMVAVVKAPARDLLLSKLPDQLYTEWWNITIAVTPVAMGDLAPAFGQRSGPRGGSRRAAPASSLGSLQRHAIGPMTRVYEANGITSEIVEAGPEPVAEAALRRGRQPGDVRGLGSTGVARGAATGPPPPRAAGPREQPMPDAPETLPEPPPPEHTMQDAPPLEPGLPPEPGFDAACSWVMEEADLSQLEARRAVLEAIRRQPAAWAMAAGAGRPADLPRPFRQAIHTQVAVIQGSAVAAPLEVPDRCTDGEAPPAETAADAETGGAGGQGAVAAAAPLARPSYAAAAAAAAPRRVLPLRESRRPPGDYWVASLSPPPRIPSSRAGGRGAGPQ